VDQSYLSPARLTEMALPEAGELLLRPRRPEDALRCDLALLTIEQGLAGFVAGEGPPARLLLPADPTLDDLLAAAFVTELAAGRALPKGAKGLAQYAAIARAGLRPSKIPLDVSLEGLFLAIRNAGPADLTDPEAGRRFTADWRRMATVLLGAARDGKDPFTTELFSDGPEFAKERAFLAADHAVYRQDVARGERWWVRLPGGPVRAAGLILYEPRSLLFKYWSRQDTSAPGGDAYLFLGVRQEGRRWIFSVDPVQRLSLKGLAEALQAADAARDPEKAVRDPWFQGDRFANTLVAAPHGGPVIDDAEVVRVVRRWLRARRVRPTRRWVAAGIAALVAGMCAWILAFWWLQERSLAKDDVDAIAQEFVAQHTGYALLVGVCESPYGKLEATCRNAVRMYRLLRDRYGYPEDHLVLLLDDAEPAMEIDRYRRGGAPEVPTRANIEKALERIRDRTAEDARATNFRHFVFYYSGHGDPRPGKGASAVGYLVLSEEDDQGGASLDQKWYRMEDLRRHIAADIDAGQKLLLIDSCFSGLAGRERFTPDGSGRIFARWSGPVNGAVLTAASGGETAAQLGGGSGTYFSEALFSALEFAPGADTNRDGVLTEGEVASFVGQAIPKMVAAEAKANGGRSRKAQEPQMVPGLAPSYGQFLFVPRSSRE